MERTRAFALGIRDGWAQPHEMGISHNVDHLYVEAHWTHWPHVDAYEWLDRGINVGQLLRAGVRSEAWQRGYWPLGFRNAEGK